MAVAVTCPTCGGYQLVPGPIGMLERCPDCLEHCRAHEHMAVVNGRCSACIHEASVATELLYAARRAAALALAYPAAVVGT